MQVESDIWREVNKLILQHGIDAPTVLARRFEEMSAAGDGDGQRRLIRVAGAIEDLLRRDLKEGELIH